MSITSSSSGRNSSLLVADSRGGGRGRGRGGKYYWVRNNELAAAEAEAEAEAEGKVKGIVVIFSWASSSEDQSQLHDFVNLYSSLGWNSLVSIADFLNPFIHERATSLAISLICELVQELRHRPAPLILAAFSGGSKACLYKFFQIIEGRCEAELDTEDSRLVSSCIAGHIYDSCPVDFSYDLGAKFALHPAILKMPGSGKLVSMLARGVTSSLDALFLTRFGHQRSEYLQTLCSSVNFGAPFLILCSESDDLAPCSIICNFARCLQDLGGNVKLVKWNDSPHVGHFRSDPSEYIAAVAELFELSASVFTFKIQKYREMTGMQCETDEMSKLICDLQNAAIDSNQSLRRVALGPNDHFFVPSSVDYQKGESSVLPDDQKERQPHWSNPGISANGVLGQVLFDACIPKNVEGWDVRFSGSLNGQPLASARKYSGFNAIKRIRRSRL